MALLEKLSFKVESATAPHLRSGLEKPNEDRLFCDEEKGIFILLDGVTRVHSEYSERPFESAASDVGDIFIEEAYRFMLYNTASEPESILRGAVAAANAKIKEYREQKTEGEWGFYPSTLGFIGLLRGTVLYYVGVGDCMAALIRRNSKLLLGREWALEALDKKNITKKERYGLYCNHPENELSYTVFNGDASAMSGVECSFIDLHEGDTLIIVSDGIGDYVKYEKCEELIRQSPEQMIALSSKYDAPPYAEYADDKTVMKITF